MDDEQDIVPAPAKTSKLVLILLGLNLVASGFGVFKLLTLPAPAAEASKEEAVDPENHVGPIHAFEPFVVNLNDIEDPRFLKVRIDVELASEEVVAKLDESVTRVARDRVMRYLSNLKLTDVMGEEAKTTIATAIGERLGTAVGDDAIKRVLFAEFVVQ